MTETTTHLNKFLAASKPSATYQVLEEISQQIQKGHDVISLCAGEPDFKTPEHVSAAAIKAINDGHTRYTPVAGLRELRIAVAKKFASENGIDCDWQDTIVSSGGKQIIFNALASTLNIGDEVIVPAPYWVSYPEIVSLCGGVPNIVTCNKGSNFKLNGDSLSRSINPNTKWLILNSPSNPTGAVYSQQELEELADVLRRSPHVLILCDDIYEHITFSSSGFKTLAQVAPDLRNRILTMNGASKGFAMTGWRIGYATGPSWLIKAMTKLQGQQTSGACSISQHAILAGLQQPSTFIEEAKLKYRERRDQLVARINSIDGLSCEIPDGAFYVFVNCEGWIGKLTSSGVLLTTDHVIVETLLIEAGVGCMHGSAFGLGPYIRISYAIEEEKIQQACDRIECFANALTFQPFNFS